MIDFEKLNSSALLELIPEHVPGQVREDDRFECKSAALLTQKHELKKELGVQVSAFSNSGGGYLVFGINGKTRQLESCEDRVGNQSMGDYLDQLVELSVDQPIRSFRVYRIPFDGEPSKGIYLIHIWDSPAAPHQAKEPVQYFHRVGNQSKPAPHFYLELLRNRFTKAVLQITKVNAKPSDMNFNTGVIWVDVIVSVKNISRQATTAWGVIAKNVSDFEGWNTGTGTLHDGEMFGSQGSAVILPGETRHLSFRLRCELGHFTSTTSPLVGLWRKVAIGLTPVSDNHAGEQYILGKWTDQQWHEIYPSFDTALTQVAMAKAARDR